jgi:hypothetical protein
MMHVDSQNPLQYSAGSAAKSAVGITTPVFPRPAQNACVLRPRTALPFCYGGWAGPPSGGPGWFGPVVVTPFSPPP